MIKSYSRGHEIYYDGSDWRYSDDNLIHDDSRPCKKCNCYPTIEGYDSCMGKIEGAKYSLLCHGVGMEYVIMDKSL